MADNKQPVFSVAEHDDAFTIFRDGEPLKTPRTQPVTVPTKALADALMAEMVPPGTKGQGEKLDLRKMPMTQMTLTAIDIAVHHRQEVIDGIMKFGDSELLCQRADDPADLVEAQQKGWQPYLDWAQEKFGIELRTGSGIIPFAQKPEALARLREFVETFDNFRLTGVSEAVGISGSLILGLALATGHADPAAVLAAAELDQLWQSKKWGSDPATEGRHAEIKRDLEMIARWFAVLG